MIHTNIKKYLEENGIKQSWLAQKIEISPSKLSEILSGKRPLYADMLFLICNSLGVSSEIFINKEELLDEHSKK